MKFIISLAAMASVAVAAPWNWPQGYCLSDSDADTIVARYAAVIAQQPSDLGSAVVTAKAIVAKNYTEQSDSANQQIGIPLGALTVASKAGFVAESQANPPLVTETQQIIHNCDTITWRWVAYHEGSGEYQIQGIHVFTINDNGKISEARFEFNSFAGALDNGYHIQYPNGTTYV